MGRKRTICVYCGKAIATTVDHIPPKELFSEPYPPNLITVPSCKKCNESAAEDDEYFKTTISFRGEIYSNPEIQKHAFPGTVRMLKNPRKEKFQRSIVRNMKPIFVRTKNGLILPTAAFMAERERIKRVVERIIKDFFIRRSRNVCPMVTL